MSDSEVEVGAKVVVKRKRAVKESQTLAYVSRRTQELLAEAALVTAQITKESRRCTGKVKLRNEDRTVIYLPDGVTVSTRRCKQTAIRGGFVCPKHGGSNKAVRRKANQRLLAMVDPALIQLGELVHQTEHRPTQLGAIRTVLERAGTNSIGALEKASGDKDMRPIINIGLAVGGLDISKVLVTTSLLPAAAATEGELVGEPDDTGEEDLS